MRGFVGGVLAGLVMFLWSAVSHMALPLGEMGLRNVPEDREAALIEVIVVTALGAFAAVSIEASYWNWYRLVLAAICKP